MSMRFIGTAGWSVPKGEKELGTHLYRYSHTFSCVEINSSFYRPHRATTWAKWARETPPNFRFSIKAPKTVTHEEKLRNSSLQLKAFFDQIQPMNEKAGPILFEPRHATWFAASVDVLLERFEIARVAADPPKGDSIAAVPGGDTRLAYYRLHGSPRIYYSRYEDEFVAALARIIEMRDNVWVIFDNTALSFAFSNALKLQSLIMSSKSSLSGDL